MKKKVSGKALVKGISKIRVHEVIADSRLDFGNALNLGLYGT
jgi:hypothetical protein